LLLSVAGYQLSAGTNSPALAKAPFSEGAGVDKVFHL